MARLNAIEGSITSGRSGVRSPSRPPTTETPTLPPPICAETPQRDDDIMSATHALTSALLAIDRTKPKSYYVSNFDPAINNFEAWCNEVERGRLANGWEDSECLSRVAHCLKGDAKTWLDEWTASERTWTTFKKEFACLCPKKIDFAQTLYEVVNTSSDKFPTYAEYARRSLLRLRVVQGLSEELMVAIIIRGITDVQIRAAAVNANLTVDNLISFLAIYVKPDSSGQNNYSTSNANKKRNFDCKEIVCHSCRQTGHKSANCSKKRNTDEDRPKITCTFCKKVGHKEEDCFVKNRSRGQKGQGEKDSARKVNLCNELTA